MLDPTTLTRRLLDRGKATTGLSYDQILKSLSVNAAYEKRKVRWAQSYEYFDGLDDPYRTMDFYVDGVMQHATTASVLRINEAEQRAAVRDGNTLLADLRTRGLIVPNLEENIANRGYETYHRKYLENYGHSWVNDSRLAYTDVRINDPAKWLTEFPIQGSGWNGNTSDVLTNLPIPKLVTDPVYLGPQFWNTDRVSGYPVNQMMDDVTEALAIIVRLHRASNCNMAMSPALHFGMRSPNWQEIYNAINRYAVDGIKDRVNTLRIASIPYFTGATLTAGRVGGDIFVPTTTLPPESIDFSISNISSAEFGTPEWNRALNTRQRSLIWRPGGYVGGFLGAGERWQAGSWNLCDPSTDYAQIMNLLAYFISLPPHVLVHSCMYFHNYLFRTSYNNMELSYGTSFANYRQLLAAEYAATSAATVNPLDLSTFGFSGTSNTLAASTVMSLPVAALAMSLGLVNPAVGIISGMLIAVSMMIADLSMDRTPRVDARFRGNQTLRDIKSHGDNTNFWQNYTPDSVINSRPIIRYE